MRPIRTFIMFTQVFISVLFIKFSCAQWSDFFWLKDEFTKYTGVNPLTPKYEEISDLDTDESAKILFRDDNLLMPNTDTSGTIRRLDGDDNFDVVEPFTHDIITWSNEDILSQGKEVFNKIPNQIFSDKTTLADKLVIAFPDDVFVWADTINTTNKSLLTTENKTENNKDKLSFDTDFAEKQSESICTFMNKIDCNLKKGVVHSVYKTNEENDRKPNNKLICCVLPLKNRTVIEFSKILFPGSTKIVRRLKRSEDIAQKQRNILLKRKYARPNHKPKQTPPPKKISVDYEYDDPYWNIKNLKTASKPKQETNPKIEIQTEDYADEYVAELPKPGITGLYSENEKKSIGWTMPHPLKPDPPQESNEYDDEDTGYKSTTINPRIGKEKRRKSKTRSKPMKFTTTTTTTTEEAADEAESQTTNFQAYPDYHVVQDYKMLNFIRKKKPKGQKTIRSTTTESNSDNDSQDSSISGPYEVNQAASGEKFKDRQIFKNCGKSYRPIPLAMKNTDKQIAETENGSHPWLALLVPTRKLNNLLCYASLIHPRAALSAADCVHRSAPREVTLIAGLWNLNERSRLKSRIVTVFVHPKYTGGLSNNLAILHWKRPLRLGLNVHPICLANPHAGDECIFVGWGGFDQGIHSRSRWQRATIHACNNRLSLNGLGVPPEAFCASVEASSTVTGFGGSLICNVYGHLSAVGVAISRDSALVLLPAYDWVTDSISIIQEQ